ncbi:UNVERIFIED_CONTAM: hypothetical protein HDU68_003036, partial [Siphonaria sp. JEL0065]
MSTPSRILSSSEMAAIFDIVKLKELVTKMVELEKDCQIVMDAAKYNVEATL